MPPKTEEMQLALVHAGGDDDCSNSSLPSPTLLYDGSTSSLKRQDSCCFTFVELQRQPSLLLSGGEVNYDAQAFETSLGYLSLRVNDLAARTLEAVQSLENPDHDSPVLKACTMSLHTRVPLLLKQASLLIQQLQHESSLDSDEAAAARIIGRLRSNFALVRLVQYLDLIESAMQNPPRELLDARLLEILQSCPAIVGNNSKEQKAFFRVSPWLAKSLAFDLPIGQTATTQLSGNLALAVEVEPIFEIHAADIVAGRLQQLRFCPCSVVIQSCKHKATPFSSGAGMIGECIIRVHLTPLLSEETKPAAAVSRTTSTWGESEEKLVIKEARAVQVNAYPPKPKANVDLYTSNLHGDAGITVTLIVKTSVTETLAEIPKLHIELFLAPSLSAVVKKST